jgi:hypothetical protein
VTDHGLGAAFDRAITQVDRALAAGMHTATGESATPELARLRAALLAERAAAVARGGVDRAWVRDTVRAVAAWTRDSELSLLAALGGIARAGGSPP